MCYTHVIGDDVGNQAHSAVPQLCRKVVKICLIAGLGVQTSRIGDIVAVHTAGTCHKKGRRVAIADSEVLKVVQQGGSVTKGENPVQLETVRGAGNALGKSLNSLRHGRRLPPQPE